MPLQRADGKQVGALSIAARADRCEQEPGLVDRLAAVLKREAAALATQLVWTSLTPAAAGKPVGLAASSSCA